MINILIASMDKLSLADLKEGFEENNVRISWAKSCDSVIAMLQNNKFDLIVTDEKLINMNGIKCIEKLILFNPLLNCAAISSLSPNDFHEASEGLGILMQLPEKPGKEDAVKLLDHLNTILNHTKKVN